MKPSTVWTLALGAMLAMMAPAALASQQSTNNGCGHKNAGGFSAMRSRTVRRVAVPPVSSSSTALTSRTAPPNQSVAQTAR